MLVDSLWGIPLLDLVVGSLRAHRIAISLDPGLRLVQHVSLGSDNLLLTEDASALVLLGCGHWLLLGGLAMRIGGIGWVCGGLELGLPNAGEN